MDSLTIITLILASVSALAALWVVPEVRRLLRLDKVEQNDLKQSLEIPASLSELKSLPEGIENDRRDKNVDKAPPIVFEKDSPFPIGYSLVKPGDRLSLAMKVFPNTDYKADLEPLWYRVEVEHPVFEAISYYIDLYDPNKNDPAIRRISFSIKYPVTKAVFEQALDILGSEGASVQLMGSVIEWDDIAGYVLSIHNAHLYISVKHGY